MTGAPAPLLPPGSLGLGGGELGNVGSAVDDATATAILTAAWAAGVRYLDTAPHYGLGLAERRLGAFLAADAGRRAQTVLSTKVGRRLVPDPGGADRWDDGGFAVRADQRRVWDFSPAGVAASLDASLARLGVDRVEICLLHDPDESPDPAAAVAEGVPAVVALREAGRVDAVGIGSKSVPVLAAAVRTGLLDVAMVAGRYTLLDRSAAALLDECRDRGVTVVVAGPFNSGVLATDTPRAGDTFDHAAVAPAVLDRARRLAAVCAAHGVALPAAALRFALRHPAVAAVVVGARTPEHVTASARLRDAEVPDALWAALAQVAP